METKGRPGKESRCFSMNQMINVSLRRGNHFSEDLPRDILLLQF